MEKEIKDKLNFIDTNHTINLHFRLASLINNLEVDKKNIEQTVNAINTASKLLPSEMRQGNFKSFIAMPDEEVEIKQNQNRSIWDVGRILIFLSKCKGLDENSIRQMAQDSLDSLGKEDDSNNYVNYKNYLGWIVKEKEEDRLDVLIRGNSAKKAMLNMIGVPLELLADEENKPLVENAESPSVLSIQGKDGTTTFSAKEMSSRLVDLPAAKAEAIKEALPGVDIILAKGVKFNTPRQSNGAGKCGDIENAIVEKNAKFIPINNGEVFIYISAIGNIYALTDEIVEGEKGGIVLPNIIYSIPRPLLIKLSMAEKLPDSINNIESISLKPVRELAAASKMAETLNSIYTRETVIFSLKEQLANLRDSTE